jgi:hypothetical protein
MDGRQRAVEPHQLAQFGQGQIRLAFELLAHGLAVRGQNQRLASRQMVPRLDAAGVPPLLQELLDHAKRHAKASGDLVPSAFIIVVGGKDALAKINGERGHASL